MTSLRQRLKDMRLALSQMKEAATDLAVVVWLCSHQGFRTRIMSGERIKAEAICLVVDLGW